MMSREDFIKQVEMVGNRFNFNTDLDLEELDYMIERLKNYWEDEEILIYCNDRLTENLKNIFEGRDEDTVYGVLDNQGQVLATSFISELSFCRKGMTFHVIEKPYMEYSLWVAFSEKAQPSNSLIVKYEL